MAFDGNTSFPLQVHVIQKLFLHISISHGVGRLEQSVGQGALPMVYVGDDAEVPDVLHVVAKGAKIGYWNEL